MLLVDEMKYAEKSTKTIRLPVKNELSKGALPSAPFGLWRNAEALRGIQPVQLPTERNLGSIGELKLDFPNYRVQAE